VSAPELKAPPAKAGEWRFDRVKNNTVARWSVTAETWFEARVKACAFFGCEPGDVMCVGRPV
jgi:hypothetical protein